MIQHSYKYLYLYIQAEDIQSSVFS
jgi:hypothetical protein